MNESPSQSDSVRDMTVEHHDASKNRARLRHARRIVVKIGSRALVDDQNLLDEMQVRALVEQLATLSSHGREVLCVSSGAVAAGLRELGLTRRPNDLPSLQAAASIGQARLAWVYREAFATHSLHTGQVLLTHDDLRSRERHLNARNTLFRLLDAGIIPVINENDTVAVEEIRVGDNDLLSAMVSTLVRADVLVLLTTVDGLLRHRDDYSNHPDEVITHVADIDDHIRALVRPSSDAISIGGMHSKLEAASMVTKAGEHALIANARTPAVLPRLFTGEPLGTLFTPQLKSMSGRKRWIAFFDHPRGTIHVDAGAARAVRERGGSLLAIGITQITGAFQRGSPVRIIDDTDTEIGRGLVNYDARDLRRIIGCRSDAIADILGQCEYDEVIHRDNLVLG